MSSTNSQPSAWPAGGLGESLEEQARLKGVHPVASVHELARAGIWESDQELDAFWEHVHASRQGGDFKDYQDFADHHGLVLL